MTAEIAILNRTAVALATDSAVTLQLAAGPPKIYNTNKLFTLSKYHPVGIMIYGNADFMDVPWEVAIKAYRAKIGKRSFASIDDYGKDFLRFIENHSEFFPNERQEFHVYGLVAGWLHRLKHKLQTEIEPELQKGVVSIQELRSVFYEVVDREIVLLKTHKKLQQFSRISPSAVLRRYRPVIQQAIADEVRELLSKKLASKIERTAVHILIKDVYWDNAAGVVIAGFGSQQIFPSLRSYEMSSIISGRLRYREDRAEDVDFDNTAIIHAFAQTEMVGQFMNGIDSDYREFIMQFLTTGLLEIYPDLVTKLLNGKVSATQVKKIKSRFVTGANKLLQIFAEEMMNYSRTFHSSPIIDIVHALPKEELAAMAEALVNLTSFKRHITHDAETVGGPIDVAVISRGDGFVWIKRKHYFSKVLNPQFFTNYYLDTEARR